MATIRQWLEESGFDFEKGMIVYHECEEEGSPGWCSRIKNRVAIPNSHYILDKNFDDGFGGPKCPRFVAKDAENIYFPSQYDGSTSIEKVSISIIDYLIEGSQTPYPGG